MSKRLHIDSTLDGNAKVYGMLKMALHDKEGNLLQSHEQPVESFINQYWLALWRLFTGDVGATYTSINNANTTLNFWTADGGGALNAYNGIVVGTSNAAVTLADVRLGGQIFTGNLANRLQYNVHDMTYNEADGTVTIRRTFTNNNATTDPTVQEAGICIATGNDTSAISVLVIRDVVGSSYVVLFGATLTVEYSLKWPFGTQNYAKLFARQTIARNTNDIEVYNATGTLITGSSFGSSDGVFALVSGLGSTTRGIVAGSGSGAEAFNTFAMGSQIGHGSNSGQLFYYDSTISSYELSTSGTNVAAFYLSRVIGNKSGSNVNIAEIGLVSNIAIGATNFTYLFDRRVMSPEIEVSNGETVTVTWGFKYNFT